MASGVELDLLRRVQALEQQVQQLSTTQRDETLQPTNITINPITGAVSALFTGGIQIPAGQELAWLNALGAPVADITSGYIPSTFSISLQPDSTDVATIEMEASPGGSSTSIWVSAIDTIRGIQQGATVLASDDSSSFLRLAGAPARVAIAYGSSTLTWGGTSAFSNNPAIAHGLGRTPQAVFYAAGNLEPWSAYVFQNAGSLDPTYIYPMGAASGTPTDGTTCTFWWMVIG